MLVALFALPIQIGGAGDSPLDRATLRGLTAVGVVVDRLDPDLEQQGLTQEVFQAAIEKRLEGAGVKVDNTSAQFVGLRVTHVRARRGPYAVCLAIGLYQPVILSRDQTIRTATATWEVETVLMAAPKVLVEASRSSVNELADRFVAAFRSVNPQSASGQ